MTKCVPCLFILFISLACNNTTGSNTDEPTTELIRIDSIQPSPTENPQQKKLEHTLQEEIKGLTGYELVEYAQTLLGVPYLYASTDPLAGFDCSGFITYVFNHFGVAVPRSSVDFTNVGKEVELQTAKEGDLILFTGTVDTIRIVGHMGIVTQNTDTLKFIHSSSGKANGVTISSLNEHYKKRLVKITRVLAE